MIADVEEIEASTAPAVTMLSWRKIRPTDENWTVYRKPDLTDPVFQELVESVRENGVTEPIEVSLDRYIISGHRRWFAAVNAGRDLIPCIVNDAVVMEQMTSTERVTLLVERNRGIRVKTGAEHYLEAAAQVDPEAAIREAQERKNQVLNMSKTSLTAVEESGAIARTDPSGERREMLTAVQEILADLREKNLLPVSGRSLHYKLLAKGVLTSTRKNGYIYGTRPGSSALLSKLLTDARSAGLIADTDLADETRPVRLWTSSGPVGHYVNDELAELFKNYILDVHADQPAHVEILVEKNTIFPLLEAHVASRFRLPITSMRGYGGYCVARDVSRRFSESSKDRLVVIYVSDLDPEGVNMPATWKKYLEHDFQIEADVFRAAVTPEQVEKYDLPPDADVKLSSTRAAGFIDEYGTKCWELDSMPETTLIDEITAAIGSVLDLDALNRGFEQEKKSDVRLARLAAKIRAFVGEQLKQEVESL